MVPSSVLDVAIGLIFIYLVASLIVTAAHELVATYLRLRAKCLTRGIINLLHGTSISSDPNAAPVQGEAWAKRFFEHQLVSSITRTEDDSPSYVPARTFALTVLHLVNRAAAGSDKAPPLNGQVTFDDLKGH